MNLEPIARQRSEARNRNQKGQAILLILVAMGLVLIGALGFAIDGAQMYSQRQMAQAAADAAAQAAMLSIFDGTNSTEATTFATGASPASLTCTTTSTATPCAFAHNNGFNTTADTVYVDFTAGSTHAAPCSAAALAAPTGVSLSTDPVNLTRVTICRTLNTTLLRFLGPSTSTIKATATAAITVVPSNIPIIITHPTLSGALSNGGASGITITGGPQLSIQVNSDSATSYSVKNIDLSAAGPNGTGGDFGAYRGPATSSGISYGTTGRYIMPSSLILDPLAGVAAPSSAGMPAGTSTTPLAYGSNGCPSSSVVKKSCVLYTPGTYPTGISVQNQTAVFSPGIYYLTTGGLSNAANGALYMATGYTDGAAGTNTGWTGNVLFYITGGGTINIGANSNATLVGSPASSTYKGMLFFVDRTQAAESHSMGGGGDISLTGTIYATNTLAIMKATPSQYQTVTLGGGSGSATVNGEIITSSLTLGGNSSISMFLTSTIYTVRQIALVN